MSGLFIEGASLSGFWLGAALVGLGLAIGTLTGLFGVGGGFLTVPLLTVLLRLPVNLAVGSDLACIVGTSTAGLRRHSRLGNFEPLTAVIIGIGSMLGAVGGVWLHEYLKGSVAGGDARAFKLIMQPVYLVLLALAGWLVWRCPERSAGQGGLLERLPLGIDLPGAGLKNVSLPGLIGVGLAIGVVTGLLGIGGGVLMMPILLVVVGLQTKQAVGTSLGIVLLGSISGTVSHGMHGNVNLWIALSLLVGTTVGVQIGAAICHAIHAARLRRWFVLIVLAAIVMLLADIVRLAVGGAAGGH